jgi:pyrimidine operon attenuation protein/uracil phosphoribosyltransferase
VVKHIENGPTGDIFEYKTVTDAEKNDKEILERLNTISETLKNEIGELDEREYNENGEHLDLYLKRSMIETSNPEQIHSLINGTLNLINEVITRQNNDEPVETLVFLDKSARNGYYLFNEMWGAFAKSGEISTDIKKPKIRFLDIGRFNDDKFTNEQSLSLLKEKIKEEDYANEKGILIIDEYFETGKSAKKALGTIKELFGHNSDAMSQFDIPPSWHAERKSGILGVDDTEIDENEYPQRGVELDKRFLGIDLDNFERLKDVYKRMGNKIMFQDLLVHVVRSERSGTSVDPDKIHNTYGLSEYSTEEMEALKVFANKFEQFKEEELKNRAIFDGEVLSYALDALKFNEIYRETAGGYISLPMLSKVGVFKDSWERDKRKHHNFRLYRKFLSTMVDEYIKGRNTGVGKNWKYSYSARPEQSK